MLNIFQLGQFGLRTTRKLWTPANLASPPSLWFNDDSAVTGAGGSLISQWNDISGNNWHATQAGAPQNPSIVPAAQNGRRITQFSGTTITLVVNSATGVFQNQTNGWIASVFKKNALNSPATTAISVFATTTPGGTSRLSYFQNNPGAVDKGQLVARRLDADAAATLPTGTTLDTNYHIHIGTMDWANGDGTIYLDGAQDAQNLALTSSGSTSNTASLGVFVGNSSATSSNYDLAELIVGRTLPSGADLQRIEGYLAHRWGLTANLPGGHPYKSIPP